MRYCFDFCADLYFRYSDRVNAETERMDRLELDDLEVTFLFGSYYSAYP